MAAPARSVAASASLTVPILPGFAWDEGSTLTVPQTGAKLKRWGSVAQACKILRCGKDTLYELIASGEVTGYKLRPTRPNSHFRVDLLSVWEHRQRGLAASKV